MARSPSTTSLYNTAMRHYATTLPQENATEGPAKPPRSDWQTLARLLPYLWLYKWRVIFALGFMVAAKMANVTVPLLLKQLVDSLTIKPGSVESFLVVPLGLLVAYGLLRLSNTKCYIYPVYALQSCRFMCTGADVRRGGSFDGIDC